jgi:dihydrofolate synthase/folylpolyglutamate synthase
MQKLSRPDWNCPLYLSGDHNIQGVESLIKILKDFTWRNLYLIAGIGADKDSEEMLRKLMELPRSKLFLTETPFKGRKLQDYGPEALANAAGKSANPFEVLEMVRQEAASGDLCIVTGSLYLVGEILKDLN